MLIFSDILMVAAAYLLGSIPFGYLLTKAAGLGDIRQIGSGNIGATNVLRTGNKKIAALTLFLDGLKGYAAVTLARYFFPDVMQIAALAALLGHIYPVWLKFKGGKGVITTLGILLALAPLAAVVTALTWILIARLSKLSSLAALIAIGLSPIYVLATGHGSLFILAMIMLAFVLLKHAPNIERLFKGTEAKIGERSNATPPAN